MKKTSFKRLIKQATYWETNTCKRHIWSVKFSCSVVSDSLWPHGPGFPVYHQLLKLMSIELVMPSNHFIFCCSLLLPSILPSIRVFSNESDLHFRWPKYWHFSFSISPSDEYSELISFRIDWFDLAVQETLKSLLQHHSSKASILQCSAFFMVQLRCSYMYLFTVTVRQRDTKRYPSRSSEFLGYCGSLVTKSCPTLVTPWTIAHQAPLSKQFSRQEYWNGFPFPVFSRGSSQSRIQTCISCIAGGFFTINSTWEALCRVQKAPKWQ